MTDESFAEHHISLMLALKNVATWALIIIGSIRAEKVAVYLGIVATLLTIYSIVKREFFTKPPK
jgi:hypothetical protein